MRSATCERTTAETIVRVTLRLEGSGEREIASGLPMLDHLLGQLAFHARCDLQIAARSLDAIEHHVIEDTAIVLGKALSEALGDRRGIARYGSALIPMDDALARAAVDLGGRAYTRVQLGVTAERVEGLEVAMIPHFFRSLASTAGVTLHLDLLAGTDPHHAIEAGFKAVARACAAAWRLNVNDDAAIASTKGVF